jgi:hypothetical protein
LVARGNKEIKAT